MIVQPCIHRIGHQHGVVDWADLYPDPRKNLGIVFHVLTDFQNRRILQHWLQKGESLLQIHLTGGEFVGTKKVVRSRRLVR